MRPNKKSRNSGAPLTQQEFWILASLSEGPKHGYAISKQIRGLTDGGITLSAATLYENIKRMLDTGLIQRVGERDIEPGIRRKVYSISALGATILNEQWTIMRKAGSLIPNPTAQLA